MFLKPHNIKQFQTHVTRTKKGGGGETLIKIT